MADERTDPARPTIYDVVTFKGHSIPITWPVRPAAQLARSGPMGRALYAYARLLSLRHWEDERLEAPLWNGGDIPGVCSDAFGFVRHLTGRTAWVVIGDRAQAVADANRVEWWAEFDAAEASA